MKKILTVLFLSCIMSVSFADVDFTYAIQNSSMPTDEEIRATVQQFNFTKEQEDAIFKDVKKKLNDFYSGKNLEQTNNELNQFYNQVENGSMDKLINPSMKQELIQDVSKMPKANSTSVQSSNIDSSKTQKGFHTKGFESKGFQSKGFEIKK